MVLEVQTYLFVFNSATFGASFALFWALQDYLLGPLGAFSGSGLASKTCLEPIIIGYQCSFWKRSPFFFFFNAAKFGTILHFLGPSEPFMELLSGSKNCLGPIYVDNKLWFWKYSHIYLLFLIWPQLGPLLHFFGDIFCLLGLFLWWRSGSKTWNLLM